MENKTAERIILIVYVLSLLLILFLVIRDTRTSEATVRQPNYTVPLSEKAPPDDALRAIPIAEEPEDFIVYVTKSGKKYHYFRDCSSLKKSTEVIGENKSSAEKEGRTPCSICQERKY